MPDLFDALATDLEARPVHVVEYAAPGWSLREAAADGGLRDLLIEIDWDVVVLQEASRMASLPQDVRESEMFPFLQRLEADVRAGGARPVLFETWAYEHGDEDVPGDSFRSMAARLERGFEEQASRLGLETAPVGAAWVEALRGRPDLDLWARDGRHPAAAGSYLAACVLATVLTGADPSGGDVTGGLTVDEARYLQAAAGTVVHG